MNRSIVGPVILIFIGSLFLAHNIWPQIPLAALISTYWPYLLIVWGGVRLVEILWLAARSRPLPRKGLAGGEVFLIVLIAIAGFGFNKAHRSHAWGMEARGLELFGETHEYPVSEQATAPPGARIMIENVTGNLQVTGADTNQVRVMGQKMIRAYNRAEADRADAVTHVQVTSEIDRVLIRPRTDRTGASLRVTTDLDISVPRGASLEIQGESGDYEIRDLNGSVNLSSGRGSVNLTRIQGNSRVSVGRGGSIRAADLGGELIVEQGRGGDLEIHNIAGQVRINGAFSGNIEFSNLASPLQFQSRSTDLRVQAIPGRLTMDLGDLRGTNLIGPVRFATRSRDVTIENFTNALEIDLERGDVQVDVAKQPVGRMDLRSKSGDIDVSLPESAKFELKGRAERGEITNAFGDTLRIETDGRSASIQGAAGQGGSPITINTGRGSISVRKAGAPSEEPARGVALRAAPVAPQFDVKPGAEAKAPALADLR
ncbi:MAG: DUF4097 family beta strand repeat-containing protein [Bryobacteraceae bacterium]